MTRKWGRMVTYPKLGDSQLSLHEKRPYGDTPHSMQVSVPSPIALTLGQVAHATLGGTLRGRRGMWPFCAKRPKITKRGHSKNHISVSQER